MQLNADLVEAHSVSAPNLADENDSERDQEEICNEAESKVRLLLPDYRCQHSLGASPTTSIIKIVEKLIQIRSTI